MKSKTIKVSDSKTNASVSITAPEFETHEDCVSRCADEASAVALENQAFTVALQAGGRRILVKALADGKSQEEAQALVQTFASEFKYGVRTTQPGEKRVSVSAVKEKIAGVKFNEAQLAALRAAGIDV